MMGVFFYPYEKGFKFHAQLAHILVLLILLLAGLVNLFNNKLIEVLTYAFLSPSL